MIATGLNLMSHLSGKLKRQAFSVFKIIDLSLQRHTAGMEIFRRHNATTIERR